MSSQLLSPPKLSVWWDVESCPAPPHVKVSSIAATLRDSLTSKGLAPPGSINVYGSGGTMSRWMAEGALSSGITFHHVARGGDDSCVKEMAVEMLLWAIDNTPPANILLISGHRDFSSVLHGLKIRRYTIFLAHPLSGKSFECISSLSFQSLVWEQLWTAPEGSAGSLPHPASLPSTPDISRRSNSSFSKGSPALIDALNDPAVLVLHTLETLREDKIVPNEMNIAARMRYVGNKYGLLSVNPHPAIVAAVASGDITPSMEDDQRIYLPKGESACWPWVDPMFPCNLYDSSTWRSLQRFLFTSQGQRLFLSSKSRYHAAERLKLEGPAELKTLVLGQLMHLIQLAITLRDWLKPHPSKWAPLQINLVAVAEFDKRTKINEAVVRYLVSTGKISKEPVTSWTIKSILSGPDITFPGLPHDLADVTPSSRGAAPRALAHAALPRVFTTDSISTSSSSQPPKPARPPTPVDAFKENGYKENKYVVPQRLPVVQVVPPPDGSWRGVPRTVPPSSQALVKPAPPISSVPAKEDRRKLAPISSNIPATTLNAASKAKDLKERTKVPFPFRARDAEGLLHHSGNDSDSEAQSAPDGMPGMKREAHALPPILIHRIKRQLEAVLIKLMKLERARSSGYELAFLKADFVREYGYPLDHAALGYPKLKNLLLEMPSVVKVAVAPGGHALLFPATSGANENWRTLGVKSRMSSTVDPEVTENLLIPAEASQDTADKSTLDALHPETGACVSPHAGTPRTTVLPQGNQRPPMMAGTQEASDDGSKVDAMAETGIPEHESPPFDVFLEGLFGGSSDDEK